MNFSSSLAKRHCCQLDKPIFTNLLLLAPPDLISHLDSPYLQLMIFTRQSSQSKEKYARVLRTEYVIQYVHMGVVIGSDLLQQQSFICMALAVSILYGIHEKHYSILLVMCRH